MDHEVRRVPDGPEHPAGRGARARPSAVDRRLILIAGAILLAAVGVGLWLLLRSDKTKPANQAPATAASIERLNRFASSVGHPIYWAGSQPTFTYELSRTKDGRVYIRYLPPGVKPGDSKPKYLAIGTYPQRYAFATRVCMFLSLCEGGRAAKANAAVPQFWPSRRLLSESD
jgi:hypothetical protein